MISAKIQEESLRTYLFRYSSLYDSISIDSLVTMFQIDKTLAHATISKMIINEELMVGGQTQGHDLLGLDSCRLISCHGEISILRQQISNQYFFF